MSGEVKANLLRIDISWTKIFYQNTLSSNYYKPNKNKKTRPCCKYKLMRPSIGIVNLQKIFTTCFVMKLSEATSMQKVFMTFNYSYNHAAKSKR